MKRFITLFFLVVNLFLFSEYWKFTKKKILLISIRLKENNLRFFMNGFYLITVPENLTAKRFSTCFRN